MTVTVTGCVVNLSVTFPQWISVMMIDFILSYSCLKLNWIVIVLLLICIHMYYILPIWCIKFTSSFSTSFWFTFLSTYLFLSSLSFTFWLFDSLIFVLYGVSMYQHNLNNVWGGRLKTNRQEHSISILSITITTRQTEDRQTDGQSTIHYQKQIILYI